MCVCIYIHTHTHIGSSIYTYWRRKWQPTTVLLPGKSHGWRGVVGYSPWGCRVGHDWMTWLSLFHICICIKMVSLVVQTAKNLPAMQKTRVQSLGQEDPLEKGMVPSPVFLPGESHGQRSLAGYSPWDCKEADTTEWLTLSLFSYAKLKIN